jgi:glycosyltransferase involved in cell wall biosynthesis
MPRVSVLLPCFNAAEHVGSCLDSLFTQDFGNIEVLAVDDGSEDETTELLEEAARRDSRLLPILRPHGGIVEALRCAVEKARGPLLARIDADDIAHPKRFALQVKFLDEHPDVDVLGSRVRLFPRQCLRSGLLRYENWVNSVLTHEEMLRDLFVESPLPHPSVMLRKGALDRVGGYRDVGWPEDYDLWMRMAREGCRFAKLPEVLVKWRDRSDRASRSNIRFTARSFLALKEHYLVEMHLANHERIGIWGAGPVGKDWALRLLNRGFEVPCFLDLDPRKIGQRIHGATVISASEVHRLRGMFLVVAVGALSRFRGGDEPWLPARSEIREHLGRAGFSEGKDFICVA